MSHKISNATFCSAHERTVSLQWLCLPWKTFSVTGWSKRYFRECSTLPGLKSFGKQLLAASSGTSALAFINSPINPCLCHRKEGSNSKCNWNCWFQFMFSYFAYFGVWVPIKPQVTAQGSQLTDWYVYNTSLFDGNLNSSRVRVSTKTQRKL